MIRILYNWQNALPFHFCTYNYPYTHEIISIMEHSLPLTSFPENKTTKLAPQLKHIARGFNLKSSKQQS